MEGMEGMTGGTPAPSAGTAPEGGMPPMGGEQPVDTGMSPQGNVDVPQDQAVDINSMDLDKFVETELSKQFEFSESDLKRMREVKEKYGLDNETLKKIVEIEADKKEMEQDPAEKIKAELQRLNPEERKQVGQIDQFFKNRLSPEQYQEWQKNFNTAEAFRASKLMMESMSNGTPDLEGNQGQKDTKFGLDNYYEYSDKIRQAFKEGKYETVDTLKQELMNKIRMYGTEDVKKLLNTRR